MSASVCCGGLYLGGHKPTFQSPLWGLDECFGTQAGRHEMPVDR